MVVSVKLSLEVLVEVFKSFSKFGKLNESWWVHEQRLGKHRVA